eukprot:TRINITY_DN23392_c0_g1_i1.p1 TRINITY_DN23392_c0_g1~~TRINITY_DN23392_c0_g1_i1.p1  ORF type:complete len:459 (-),score=105.55 TRINITY_DN23392_c0_g1_i1:211-1413(-)
MGVGRVSGSLADWQAQAARMAAETQERLRHTVPIEKMGDFNEALAKQQPLPRNPLIDDADRTKARAVMFGNPYRQHPQHQQTHQQPDKGEGPDEAWLEGGNGRQVARGRKRRRRSESPSPSGSNSGSPAPPSGSPRQSVDREAAPIQVEQQQQQPQLHQQQSQQQKQQQQQQVETSPPAPTLSRSQTVKAPDGSLLGGPSISPRPTIPAFSAERDPMGNLSSPSTGVITSRGDDDSMTAITNDNTPRLTRSRTIVPKDASTGPVGNAGEEDITRAALGMEAPGPFSERGTSRHRDRLHTSIDVSGRKAGTTGEGAFAPGANRREGGGAGLANRRSLTQQGARMEEGEATRVDWRWSGGENGTPSGEVEARDRAVEYVSLLLRTLRATRAGESSKLVELLG